MDMIFHAVIDTIIFRGCYDINGISFHFTSFHEDITIVSSAIAEISLKISILPCTTMHIYKLIKGIIENHRYQKILDEAYEQDQLIAKLSHTFGVQFRRDWVGRLYAVVNPAIKDGRFDNTQVFEYAQGGYDTTEHAKQWIVERTIMMENFIQTNNLFDALAFDVKRLDDNGNYLFVLMPVTLPVVLANIKGSIYELLFGTVAIGAAIYWWPW